MLSRPGLVLRCLPDGRVDEVLHRGLDVAVQAGQPITEVVASASADAAQHAIAEAAMLGGSNTLLLLRADDRDALPVQCTAVGDDQAVYLSVTLVGVEPIATDPEAALGRGTPGRSEADSGAEEQHLTAELSRINGDLVAAQLELQRRTDALERVNRRRNEILGMAAHDLRNPLQGIRGFADTLRRRDGAPTDERERQLLDRIVASSDHMLGLVHELLTVSELEAGEVRLEVAPVDVAEIVTGTVSLLEAGAERKGITVTVTGASAPQTAELDRRKIEQVVQNLVSNALKFSPRGSHVEVGLDGDADRIRIRVTDHGPGIAVEEIAELFRPFGRTSAKATGGERSTGLGLAIARSIVEHHGGSVDVFTKLGEGSTFEVSLPRVAPGRADLTGAPNP